VRVDVGERELRELTRDERIECGFAETVHWSVFA
jgi:hypothetical protein